MTKAALLLLQPKEGKVLWFSPPKGQWSHIAFAEARHPIAVLTPLLCQNIHPLGAHWIPFSEGLLLHTWAAISLQRKSARKSHCVHGSAAEKPRPQTTTGKSKLGDDAVNYKQLVQKQKITANRCSSQKQPSILLQPSFLLSVPVFQLKSPGYLCYPLPARQHTGKQTLLGQEMNYAVEFWTKRANSWWQSEPWTSWQQPETSSSLQHVWHTTNISAVVTKDKRGWFLSWKELEPEAITSTAWREADFTGSLVCSTVPSCTASTQRNIFKAS